jgi:hypothetical protein
LRYWVIRYWVMRYWVMRYWVIRYWVMRYWVLRYWVIRYWVIRYWVMRYWVLRYWVMWNWVIRYWVMWNWVIWYRPGVVLGGRLPWTSNEPKPGLPGCFLVWDPVAPASATPDGRESVFSPPRVAPAGLRQRSRHCGGRLRKSKRMTEGLDAQQSTEVNVEMNSLPFDVLFDW